MILLKNCRFVVTQNSQKDILENVDILIKKSKISKIKSDLSVDLAEEIDASKKIVMPGLINLHTHAAMTLFRGAADDMPFHKAWPKIIWPAEAKMKEKDYIHGNTLAAKEMIMTGTTCFNDMYFRLDLAAEIFHKSGLRAFLSHATFDTFGEFNAEKFKESSTELKKISHLVRTLKSDTINFALGPHAPYTNSGDLLDKSRGLAEEWRALLHIHLCENKQEVDDFQKDKGLTEIEFLDSIGFLSNKVIGAHCCHLTDKDIDIISKNDVSIAHCPSSNMKLVSGVLPLEKLQKAGVNVGLGTDGCASNNSLDMFQEMKICALKHKSANSNATIASAQEVLDMATVNGAEALKIKAGSIEEGKLADIILVDLNEVKLQPTTKKNVISNLVYSCSGECVSDTIVNGKILMRNRKLISRFS